jgi:CBS domain containing-hemolysin-like protein
MLSFLLALALAVVMLLCVMLQKTYHTLPSKELKRRAETGNELSARLWPAVAYGPTLQVLLWTVLLLAGGACFVLLARIAPPVLGFLAVTLLLVTAFAWVPKSELKGFEARFTVLLTPAVVWLLGTLDPVLSRLARYVHRPSDGHLHTNVYIREDLINLIERQKSQPDNELTIEELTIAGTALRFGERKVRELMTKRKKVVVVNADNDISPVMLDELHKTEHSRFPVYEGEPDNFVGALYLSELTSVGSGKGARGKVRNRMSPGIAYVHEADTLAEALHAFYLTKKQLFIVINKFEEYVGLITIEDMVHALLGKPGEYVFDQHESRSAVAAKHVKKPKVVDEHIDETVHQTHAEETPPATTDEVVE